MSAEGTKMEAMIKIGGGPTVEAIEAATKSVLEILNSKADQKTIRRALDLLKGATRVPNVEGLSFCDMNLDASTHSVAPETPEDAPNSENDDDAGSEIDEEPGPSTLGGHFDV